MKKLIGQILSAILLGTSVLLGLAFWLNVHFGFNIFYAKHWDKLAKMQAMHASISKMFYVSLGVAIFVFIVGLYLIFKPRFRYIFKHQKTDNVFVPNQTQNTIDEPKPQTEMPHAQQSFISLSQPPKLNLPKNTAEIVMQRYNQPNTQQKEPLNIKQPTIYDSQLFEMFTNAGYLVKPNLTITGFTTNLFAIGTNEIAWFGAVDCDMDRFKKAVDKLRSIFAETLDDVQITVATFILDTKNLYNSDEETSVFHTLDELQACVNNNPNPQPDDSEQENFNAYSDYIDTIIQYAKNV